LEIGMFRTDQEWLNLEYRILIKCAQPFIHARARIPETTFLVNQIQIHPNFDIFSQPHHFLITK
jgi:hypothetical protein